MSKHQTSRNMYLSITSVKINKIGFLVFFIFAALNLSGQLGHTQEVVVDVSGRPALNFKLRSDEVKGFVIQKGNDFEAKDIHIGLTNLKTGLETRDKHTKKYLETEKFPEAILIEAKGSAGKGTGKIKIRGIEKNIAGTYEIKGSAIEATFPLKLSEFGISGIKYMGVGVNDDVTVHATIPVKK